MAEDESTNVDGLDGLADHEVRQLVMAPDAPPCDGTKSIKQANLFGFFKIINIIIANNIDPRQHKTEVGMNWAGFMIRIAREVFIDLVSYIFTRIRSKANYITIDILPFVVLITRFMLAAESSTLSHSTGRKDPCTNNRVD